MVAEYSCTSLVAASAGVGLIALLVSVVPIAVFPVIFLKTTANYWHKVDCADTSEKNPNNSAAIWCKRIGRCFAVTWFSKTHRTCQISLTVGLSSDVIRKLLFMHICVLSCLEQIVFKAMPVN